MNPGSQRRLDIVAAIGLGIGAVFGLAGTLVSQAPVRQIFWAIDGVGLVVASALLTVKFLRKGNDCIAAGFLVFVIGESLLVSGTAVGLAGSVPSFGGGVALWPLRFCSRAFRKSSPNGFVSSGFSQLCSLSSWPPESSGVNSCCQRPRPFRSSHIRFSS